MHWLKKLWHKKYLGFYKLLYPLAIVGIAVVVCTQLGMPFLPCLVHYFFHIPCPGCGMTRAVSCMLSGDFAGALHYNALSFIVVPMLIIIYILLIVDLFPHDKTYTYSFYRAVDKFLSKWYVLIPTLLLVLAVWIHHFIIGL